MKKNLILITGLLAINTIFAQKKLRYEIPFTMDRNLILINAEISQHGKQRFIFDTGTESIMLSNTLTKTINF